MACGSRRVTIQLVNEETGPKTKGPKLFRGQNFKAIRAACLDEGILFRDPYFPAGPDALGYDQLGPHSEKAKGVEWKRPHLWQFGRWVDVVVDDRLPVCEGKLMFVRSDQRNEFWAPLLEKAYAKLHGSYEVMRGGHMNEAFVDFTGGVGEVLYLKKDTPNPPGLFSILRHALAKESLVGATALSDRGEYRTEDGLVKGHAYSVTGTHKVSLGFTKVRLLRLRNPWGRVEWNGAWSDRMELLDFFRHFDTVQICSLSPEVLGPSPAGGGWHIHTFQGRWVRGFNSGGSQPGAETFWTNPQFRLTLLEPDEEDEEEDGSLRCWGAAGARGPARGARTPKCTVLLSLIQRNQRRLRAQGLKYLTVGFHVFQATFDKFDEDASGTMNSYELRLALNAAGFHLNNQLTQALTSRYRDSRLRVDFERFVSCMAQLICIFRHCSQHLDGGEGVVCLTHRQVSLECRARVAGGGMPGAPSLTPPLSSGQWMQVATFS
ncbi:hypothetical protein G4228_002792 [Cervus hanglu yarkandensis]|nr:hypothetical protein G4228_002792 [Cervus hanglu yarkandensis]